MVNVYESDNKFYLNGFDYSRVFNIEMGIDSKIHYYLVNIEELKKKVQEEDLSYHLMKESQKNLIADRYYSERDDRLRRISGCSDLDLQEWREQLVQDIVAGRADGSLLIDIDNEIYQRSNVKAKKQKMEQVASDLVDKLLDRYTIYELRQFAHMFEEALVSREIARDKRKK